MSASERFALPPIDSDVLDKLLSPSMIVFSERVHFNIDQMIQIAGSTDRLRPHCKTHKMPAIVRILLDKGITHHKAATVAEAEMLADAGAPDVVLAYNPVGPNIQRVIELAKRFPSVQFAVTADHEQPVRQLSEAAASQGVSIGVMLDVDVGQHRTGIDPRSDEALQLYQWIHELPGLQVAGFHVYDGHQHQDSVGERQEAVLQQWPAVLAFRDRCQATGIPVPELLCGGTPTFPVYAKLDDPEIMLSPGTSILHDYGYGGHFADLPFKPAAALVTRVISRPRPNRVTLDLGNKAVAADPPKGARVFFADLPDARQVIHNEEHLVLETDEPSDLQPGDVLLGIPVHVCPTSALHDSVAVIEDGKLAGYWDVVARSRKLTI
jgi:D-serine deaminase-like pyridoxal phosphate-dependent protein